MDLIEYMRFRWIPLTILFVVGLIGIVVVGSGTTSSGYEAAAKLTIRPAASQSDSSDFNLDRYIGTEMSTIYDPDELDAVLQGTDVSRGELAQGLTTKHKTGSESVTMRVQLDNRDDAVTLVNRVAARYVTQAKARSAAPLESQQSALKEQITALNKRLAKANQEIQDATEAFIRDNPDRGVPGASTLAPDANSRASLLQSQLQKLSQDLIDVEETASQGNQTEVTTEAKSAVRPQPWSIPVFLSALLALVLVLLTLASVGLLLSRRILSAGRWNAVTAGSGLQSILPMSSRRASQRQRDVNRALLSLQDAGPPEAETLVVYLPGRSKAATRNVEPLLSAIEDQGLPLREVESLEEAWAQIRSTTPQSAPRGAHSSGDEIGSRVLLVASRHRATRDDAAVVADRPGPHLDRVVPVLT